MLQTENTVRLQTRGVVVRGTLVLISRVDLAALTPEWIPFPTSCPGVRSAGGGVSLPAT